MAHAQKSVAEYSHANQISVCNGISKKVNP
jgi:hypothetical protein